ncbi:siderophore-interacting protein [Devosia sp. A8/3-2]|nr:siderophore-interacting protein [Devosia sp. A8/3-2]
MLRLTFGGPGLADWKTTGIGDEYLRLFFPNEQTGKLHLPHIDEQGRWTYPDGQDAIRCSTYTIRRHDAAKGQSISISSSTKAGSPANGRSGRR